MVDDRSDDHTPDLVVLRRDPPNARIGKAAALIDADRTLDLAAGSQVGRRALVTRATRRR